MYENLKIIVYSICINGYDTVKVPEIYDKNIDYILFSDDMSISPDVWKVVPIDFLKNTSIDDRKKSRYAKLNSHLVLPEHDISIWIDHSYIPKFNDVKKLLEDINFGNSNIMQYKHPKRNCLYDEANEVLRLKLDFPVTVNKQLSRYYGMGFPKNYGLFECGFLIRRNNLKTRTFNDAWWKEVLNNSGRDQLSQMFVSWSIGVNITPILVGDCVDSNEFLSERISHEKTFRTQSF